MYKIRKEVVLAAILIALAILIGTAFNSLFGGDTSFIVLVALLFVVVYGAKHVLSKKAFEISSSILFILTI